MAQSPGPLPPGVELTKEETDKLSRAFDDPTFRRMLMEYAADITDPKAREENEAYLRQLEGEGRAEEVYGAGSQLVAPSPALVVKTRLKAAAGGDGGGSDGASGGGAKVFINICTSDKVAAPSMQACEEGGRRGCFLQIPNCLGAKPMELPAGDSSTTASGGASAGPAALAWVFVVHPLAVQQAAGRVDIMETLISVAKDEVAKACGSALSAQHKILKRAFKGPPGFTGPSTLLLRTPQQAAAAAAAPGSSNAKGGSELSDAARPGAPRQQDAGISKEPRAGSKFAFSGKPTADASKGSAKAAAAPRTGGGPQVAGGSAAAAAAGGEPAAPSWKLVFRDRQDLGDTWGDAGRGISARARLPQELVLRVHLPGVTSAAGLQLDIGRRTVSLGALPGRSGSCRGTAALEVPLPHDVDSGASAARFDQRQQQLVVTMPVLAPPAAPAAAPLAAPPAANLITPVVQPVAGGTETAAAGGGSDGARELPSVAAVDADGSSGGGGGKADCAAVGPGAAAGSKPARAPAPAVAETKTPNQLLWERLHAAGKPQETGAPARQPAEQVEPEDGGSDGAASAASADDSAGSCTAVQPAAAAAAPACTAARPKEPAAAAPLAPQPARLVAAALVPRVLGAEVDEID